MFLLYFSEKVMKKKMKDETRQEISDGVLHQTTIMYIHSLSNYSRKIYEGFAAKPLCLENSYGKLALNSLLQLCCFIGFKEEGYDISVDTLGSGVNYDGNCKVRMYHLRHTSDDNARSYLSKEAPWPPRTKVYKQCTTKIPDVQVRLRNDRGEYCFPITGEVKSASESSEEKRKDAIQQTIKQALVGLRHRDVSYGILLEPLDGHIIRIVIKDATEQDGECWNDKVLKIYKKSWSFGDHPNAPFNTNQFIAFMKAIMAIMLKF